MTKFITWLGLSLLACGVVYGLGSFIEAGFDISRWEKGTRVMGAMIGGILSAAAWGELYLKGGRWHDADKDT